MVKRTTGMKTAKRITGVLLLAFGFSGWLVYNKAEMFIIGIFGMVVLIRLIIWLLTDK